MNIRRAISTSVVPLAAAIALVIPTAGSASATASTGCNASGTHNGCIRLFYNSDRAGSSTYFDANVSDLAGYTFLTSGTGKGNAVKNNAASALNDSPTMVTIYYNSGYVGACDTLSAYAISDKLHYTYNNDASFRWDYTRSDCYDF
ncbi:peptidase inhibitor family I36 protein [Streptomyces sp. NPDC127066]|uniref:peptidase inhibitor family I36 protein n=1 Tax=Streptomyces sp. NPDC127066 TaxID=3347125 RepID=UPI00365EC2F4